VVTVPVHKPVVTVPVHKPVVTVPVHKPVVTVPVHKPVVTVPVYKPVPSKPKPCGKTRKWVLTYTKWGKKKWVRKTYNAYCKKNQVCCNIPRVWGWKSWGKKCPKKGTRTQKRCYWRKCPKWYKY